MCAYIVNKIAIKIIAFFYTTFLSGLTEWILYLTIIG